MTDSFVEFEGVRLSFLDRGDGVPLLWLHGLSGRDPWDAFLSRLAESYRVVVPEHPGFGSTDRVPWIRDMEDMALFYRSFIETYLPADGIVLAGHSLGAWMAAEFAFRHPERLRALVLTSPLGLLREDAPVADVFLLEPEEFRQRAYADPDKAPPPADTTSIEWIRNRSMTAQFGWSPRLFSPRLAERLRWINRPTLLLHGELDRIVPPSHTDLYASLLPDAQVALLPGVGHHPHHEDPEGAAVRIVQFLEKKLSP
ncbi:MAG: alpha/beta fold hydrolase [Streptosporangiales bacterium]|nr:alpha/beta fold hydrolase [Streptosporangiales bacterium]